MKIVSERIHQEKQLWLDLFKFFKRMGYLPKWEIASQTLTQQKIWKRIESHHQESNPAFYGFSFTIGRIGNHDLRFCIEMQNELKFGLRFREGIKYWTEDEIQNWGELTIRLDNDGSWTFDIQGWFATKNLPVRLDFTNPTNSASLDLEYYKEDSYAKLLIVDELLNSLNQVKSSNTYYSIKKYGTYIN